MALANIYGNFFKKTDEIYSRHVVGPDILNLEDRGILFNEGLETYLNPSNELYRQSFNDNFNKNIITRGFDSGGNEIYSELPLGLSKVGEYGNDSFLNTPKFGQDMISYINETNSIDWANQTYAYETMETSAIGKSIEIDAFEKTFETAYSLPGLPGSGKAIGIMSGIAGAASGALLPYLFSKKEGSNKRVSPKAGIALAGATASTYIKPLSLLGHESYAYQLMGLKGLNFNLGTLLLGSAINNFAQGVKDIKNENEKRTRGKGICELGSSACFAASSYNLISSSMAAWTSLAYEGFGIYSISTFGAIAASAASGMGLVFAGIGLGIKLGNYIYRKFASKENKKITVESTIKFVTEGKKNKWQNIKNKFKKEKVAESK